MPPRQHLLTAPAPRLVARLSFLAVLGLLVWNLGSMATFMIVGRAPVPFNDQWDTAYFPDHWLDSLFDLHNEHRPTLARLIGILDWRFVAGGNQINATFIFLCFPLLALAIYGLVQAAGSSRARAALIAALALAIISSNMQWENLLWGFQTAFTGSFAFGLIALALAAATAMPPSGARAWGAFALCLVASLCAVFGLASGLLVLPSVFLVLMVAKTPIPIRAAYGVFALVIIGLYFHKFGGEGVSNPAYAMHHPGRLVVYVLGYLGGALNHSDIWRAAGFGLAGLIVFALAFANGALNAKADSTWIRGGRGLAYLALLLSASVIFGAAGMASVGRSQFGLDQALASRYSTASLIFWADLAVLCLVAAESGPSRLTRLLTPLGWVLGLGLAVHTAVGQAGHFADAREDKAERINAMIAYDLGVRDHPVLFNIYPAQAFIVSGALESRFQEMKRDRKAIFAQGWPWRLGQPLGAWTRLAGQCEGFIDSRGHSPGAAPSNGPVTWMVGWSFDEHARRPPDLIVFADEAGNTIGFGEPGYQRPDVSRALHRNSARASGWTGFARVPPDRPVHAYAVNLNGAPTACAFAVNKAEAKAPAATP